MNSLFFIQYNPKTYTLTNITSDNKFGDNSWFPVGVSYVEQNYFKNNYKNIQYDPNKKILIFPQNASVDNNLINNNLNLMDSIIDKLNANSQMIDTLRYKIAWNHVMSIYTLPDDLAFLNKNYSIPIHTTFLNISDFVKTGIYNVPAYASLNANDGPKGINFNNGYTFKIYKVSNSCFVVIFINSNAIWVNTFANNHMLKDWNKIFSF